MKANLGEMTIGIESDLITPTSPNFRIPSWPPPRDWPVVIDKAGVIITRWGDPKWILTPWAGRPMALNFGDGKANKKREAEPLDGANADLMRMVATWFIWGTQKARAAQTIYTNFYLIRSIVALCSRNGISAARLMRFPKVFEQVPEVVMPSSYQAAIALLHYLYDARDMLGFTIVDLDGLRRLTAAAPAHDRVQTAYIPPRIWVYQVTRLHECLMDFLAHREQMEACFQFCLDAYIERWGSLENALSPRPRGAKRVPFGSDISGKKGCSSTFAEVATRFGISGMLVKWTSDFENSPNVRSLSQYFSAVTFAGLAYICNFTLQRKEEVGSLRASCLVWDEDEKLGRVPIICGETTKTDPDSDARWVASPSIEIAIQALSCIARLRMICDRANPLIRPSAADQADPYLFSTPTEPWVSGRANRKLYEVRGQVMSMAEAINKGCVKLFDPEQMRTTAEDLEVARRLTPNLPEDEFAVGKVWPLAWHQYRRTGAVNMFASGDISDSTMQQLLKHSSRLMPLYYGRNHSRLHFNKEVQTAVVVAMYQAQAEIVKAGATDDRFVSPNSQEKKDALVMNVLSAKDINELTAMAKKGAITFREHRLGGCMKAGLCEYGGIESVARCAGGDGLKPCTEVLYDRAKEPVIRADLRRVTEEIKLLSVGQPRYNALIEERAAMENYLNAVSTN